MITQDTLDRALDASLPHAAGDDRRCLNDRLPWPCPVVAVATDAFPNMTMPAGRVVDPEAPLGRVTAVKTDRVRQRAVASIGRHIELNAAGSVLSVRIDQDNRETRLVRVDVLDNARVAEAGLLRAGYAVEWVTAGEYEPVLRVGPIALAVA